MRALYFAALCAVGSPLYAAPDLLLAQEFKGQNVSGWAMSEKLDGVRAYWDGKRLISRQGYAFSPPKGFTDGFPAFAMDGELYSGRGKFEQISAAVRAQNGDWSGIKLHVFDVPKASGNLYQRLQTATAYLNKHPQARFTVIRQIKVQNNAHAQQWMEQIVREGGEGVMLRHPDQPYTGGRSPWLLKLKPVQDAECTVTRYHEGKGKYAGKLGAVSCKNELGEFRIGSGFKDKDRDNPPPIGSKITYKYRGLTQKGLPRFATYLRPYKP